MSSRMELGISSIVLEGSDFGLGQEKGFKSA